MSEPTNTAKRRAVAVKKGKLDLHQRRQGELPKTADKVKGNKQEAPNGIQEMDLAKVDNNNELNYQEYEPGKDEEDVYDNIDFGKLHDDFAAIKDSKKDPNAGK